jgi:hypothetical protein
VTELAPGFLNFSHLRIRVVANLMARIFLCAATAVACDAQTLNWMGHTWNETNGGMAGVIRAKPSNIFVDSNGYLHLRITEQGRTYTGSEMFTQDNMGFGTYQWQIDGNNIYAMDPPVVLGLFPYGAANGIGKDGENEIDIEFSNWNGAYNPTPINADFTDYPSTGHRRQRGQPEWEDDFNIKARPRYTTARMVWSSDRIIFTVMDGLVPIKETEHVLKLDVYKGNTVKIPQDAIPVGMNLWCFQKKPKHTWEIVVRNFEFVPQ